MSNGAAGSVLNGGGEGAGAGAGAAGAGAAGDWFAGLPDDIKGDPSLKVFQGEKGMDLAGLTKSYVNAQKMIGADKVVLPGKNSSEADWKALYQKMGLPETVDKYEIKLPEGTKLDENMIKGFKSLAHGSGILPAQAEKIVAWFQGEQTNALKSVSDGQAAATLKGINDLKAEWGQGYEKKIAQAHLAISEFTGGDETFGKFLDESGVGNNPMMIKLFAKIGESLGEDKLKGGAGPGRFGKTPEEARQEINTIMSDTNHPYWNGNHAGHNDAVLQMQKLHEMVVPQTV